MKGISYYTSPVGELEIQSEDDAITVVGFLRSEKLSEKLTPVIQTCVQELDEYFHSGRKFFDVKLKLQGSAFQQNVWNQLIDINSVRAVGLANGQNPIAIIVPCHRVIGKDGSLVGYGGGLDKKVWLLRHEGALNQLELF
jgi:methylated-DNA-[protein]-cysteine S-methyltransferase